MRRVTQIACASLLAVAGLFGAGCGDDPAPAAAPPPRTAPAASTAAAAATTTSGATGTASSDVAYVYQYNPVAKRDPFKPPEAERSTENSGPCTEPLCQFELDQLTLVGVVTGMANPFGMVEDPQGRGYVIRRNTKMGKQGGKVTNILRDSVTVTEYWTGPDGKQNPNPVSLQLKPDPTRAPEMDLNTGKNY